MKSFEERRDEAAERILRETFNVADTFEAFRDGANFGYTEGKKDAMSVDVRDKVVEDALAERDKLRAEQEKRDAAWEEHCAKRDKDLASARASLEKSRKHVEESENEIVELQAENNAARAELNHNMQLLKQQNIALDAAKRDREGLLEALERLTKVGPPSRSCNGDEIFQVQIQDNCNIARDAINKFGGKGE